MDKYTYTHLRTYSEYHSGKVKGKVFPYSLPSVGPGADPSVGSQPAGDVK